MPSNCASSSLLNAAVRPVFGLRNSVVRMEPGRNVSRTGTTGRISVRRGRLAGARVTSSSRRA